MKIGILTFHHAYNYGAVLQAYGSVCVLRELGHQAEIVNYIPGYFLPHASHFRGLGFRNGVWTTAVPNRLAAMPRRLAFDRFRHKYLPISGRLRNCDLSSLEERYDILYVGSDQVWNLNWMNGFDGFYFCGFLSADAPVRAIAYASCFGTARQPEDRLLKAGLLIQRFSAVGTRNQMSAAIVKKISGANSTLVCDPTMLYDFKSIRRSQRSADYIIVYALNDRELGRAKCCCDELHKRYGVKPIWFIANDDIARCGWADRVISGAGPVEWMNLIADADAVVTDSFHGAIFAMKFGRTLRAYSSNGRADRFHDLFESVGVSKSQGNSSTPMYLWCLESGDTESLERVAFAINGAAKDSRAWLEAKISRI